VSDFYCPRSSAAAASAEAAEAEAAAERRRIEQDLAALSLRMQNDAQRAQQLLEQGVQSCPVCRGPIQQTTRVFW